MCTRDEAKRTSARRIFMADRRARSGESMGLTRQRTLPGLRGATRGSELSETIALAIDAALDKPPAARSRDDLAILGTWASTAANLSPAVRASLAASPGTLDMVARAMVRLPLVAAQTVVSLMGDTSKTWLLVRSGRLSLYQVEDMPAIPSIHECPSLAYLLTLTYLLVPVPGGGRGRALRHGRARHARDAGGAPSD